MSREAFGDGAHMPNQKSNKYIDPSCQAASGQTNLLQLHEDSQDANNNTIIRDSSMDALAQNIPLTQTTEANYFTRPVVETTEEIGTFFKFGKAPPPRMISHGPGAQQGNLTPQPQPQPVNDSSYSNLDSGSSGFNGQDGPVEPPILVSNREEARLYCNNDRDDDEIVDMVVYPKYAPDNIPGNTKSPSGNLSGSTSAKDTLSFPFLDDTVRPNSSGKVQTPHYSPLPKAQLPKAISDTRRKALAQISPHNMLPRTKAILSPSTDPPSAQPRSAPNRRPSSGTIKHSGVHKRPQNQEQALQAVMVDDSKSIAAKSSRNKRHKAQGLVRPMPLDAPEYEVVSTRPCSQASNISKPRAPPRANYKRHTPTREQNEVNLRKFAESWNINHLYNQRLLDRWGQKIELLEDHVASQDLVIGKCRETIGQRDQTIYGLSTELETLRSQNQEVQEKANISSEARKRLEDKLRSYRVRLNEAIAEQQRLYVQCRQDCEKVTADIEYNKKAREESIEKASTTLERLRNEMKQEVASVVRDANKHIDQLGETIKSLENGLKNCEVELERERQHSQDLAEHLSQFQKLNEHSVQSASVQNQKLLDEIKQSHKHAQNTETRIRNQEEKIDLILKTLEQTNSKTVDPAVVLEKLREVHSNIATAIIAEFQDSIVSSRDSAIMDQEDLNGSIGEIRLLCEGICEKLTGLNDVAIWQERAHNSDMNIHNHIQNIQDLQNEIHGLYIRINDETEERQELERRLAIATINEQTTNERIKTLTGQTERLQKALDEKEIVLSESQKAHQALQEELRRQARLFEDRERDIQNELNKYQETIELHAQQHNQEVSRVVTEKTKEIRENLESTKKRLEDVEATRVRLEEELSKSRQEGETSKITLSSDLRQIQDEVLTATTSITKITADLQENGSEQKTLRENLEGWSRNRVEVDQMKHILQRLARDQPNAIQMSDQLKQLLEIQKKLTGTLEYHHARVTDAEAGHHNQNRPTKPANSLILMSNPQSDVMPHMRESLEFKRKVIVKSPVTKGGHALPMTVEQERSTRRHTAPLRGIMKVIAHDISEEAELNGSTIDSTNIQAAAAPQLPPKRKVAKRGSKPSLTTYSIYNRPVAGSILEIDHGEVEAGQAGSSGHTGHNTSISNSVDSDSIAGEPPTKKQRNFKSSQLEAQEPNIAERVKLSRSTSTYFRTHTSDGKESTKGKLMSPNGSSFHEDPIKRKSRGLMAYSSQNPSKEPSHSQSSTVSGTTEEADSQSTLTSCQTIGPIDSQACEQDVVDN